MAVIESYSLAQSGRWLEVARDAGATDVYYYPAYVLPFEANGDGTAELFVYRHPWGTVVFPGLVRPIQLGGASGYFDLTSPYGYAGPIIHAFGPDRRAVAEGFRQAWQAYCVERKIVSEFVRFHPLLQNDAEFTQAWQVEALRSTVYIDLSPGPEAVWVKAFSGRARTAIRKSQNQGVEFRLGHDEAMQKNFRRLYGLTMDRLGTSPYYQFSPIFFQKLHDTVKEHGTYLEAWYQGQAIASIVLLRGQQFLHYHLSGSDPSYREIPSSSQLLWEAARWGCEMGLEAFHLGGGYVGDEDRLFMFKSSFSPARARYCIGKVVHLPDIYQELVHARAAEKELASSSFFPLYRQL